MNTAISPKHEPRPGGHVYDDREDGLSYCDACGGGEGSLPTQCPGERMGREVEGRVYAGALDYVDGRWIQHRIRGLVIRFPLEYWYLPRTTRRADGPSCPLSAVERWGPSRATGQGSGASR